MDITTVSTALNSVKMAIDIAKTLKNSDDLFEKAEIKLQLAKLIGSLADAKMLIAEIQEDLIECNKEKNKLEEEINFKENLIFKRPYYLIKQSNNGTDGPFCQICYDNENKLIRLHDSNINGVWDCPVCHQDFYDENYDLEEAEKRKKDIIDIMKSFQ